MGFGFSLVEKVARVLPTSHNRNYFRHNWKLLCEADLLLFASCPGIDYDATEVLRFKYHLLYGICMNVLSSVYSYCWRGQVLGKN